MTGVWAKGLKQEKNISLAFTLDLGEEKEGVLRVAGLIFKAYCDGETLGSVFRAAHGYARVSEFSFKGRYLAVETAGYNIKSFSILKEEPFIWLDAECEGRHYTQDDFICRRITDRVRKVQRYSYQRCFAEIYDMAMDRGNFEHFPAVETEASGDAEFIENKCLNPNLILHTPVGKVNVCSAAKDASKPVWRDRAHLNVGEEIDGFDISEWEQSATDDASRFVYGIEGGLSSEIYDFGRSITGFFEVEAEAESQTTFWLIFDEILFDEAGKGDFHIDFSRNTCSNVLKWTLLPGKYKLKSFEEYTARYVRVVIEGKAKIFPAIRDFENPEATRLQFESEDKEAEKIIEAARNSFAQNAVDLLTDCPSRERAGWLCDSWFTSVSERLFTGRNRVEEAFLENYAHFFDPSLPDGMLPMCYPADNYAQTFIPNWAMWYVHEIVKYAGIYGKNEVVKTAFRLVEGVVRYFDGKINEKGLLENLDHWVFIEWSSANDAERICGVNVPSNFCWASALQSAGALYGRKDWIEKGEKMAKEILRCAYDGRFFVDNLIRKDGKLVRTDHYTEVCQYFAFWFHVATPEDYPELFTEMMNHFGGKRKEGYMPKMGAPNVFCGIYMRLDLLMREGNRRQLYEECKYYFLKMAQRTGTLWENKFASDSLDHGFASYAAKWIIYALTGYDAIKGERTSKGGIGVACRVKIPVGEEFKEIIEES